MYAGLFYFKKQIKMYYTYILYSQQLDKYYVGSTSDVKSRPKVGNQA
ncbi:MAG: GIY-YIG nuclease family protein [Bacteroidota bacterium]